MLRMSLVESGLDVSSPTVLVVEDESIDALDIQRRLMMMGYRVADPVATAAEALAMIAREKPDLVLMDIRLKRAVSGMEITHKELEVKAVERETELTRLNEQLAAVNEKLRREIEARERAQSERAAAQEERRRLAQDIHDSVTQSIFSLIFTTQAARAAAQPRGSGPMDETLEEVEAIARQALKDLRLLLYQLRSPLLDHGGLAPAIRHRLDSVELRAGVRATLVAPSDLTVAPAAEEGAYRVAMEALNNSLKHARATEESVELQTEGSDLVLIVRDNGVGFDERALARNAGLGFLGMQERATRLGGTLSINSAPREGTTVTLRINRFAIEEPSPESET